MADSISIPGLFGASPFQPVIMIVSKSAMTMESMYDWTYEELSQKCEDYGVQFMDVWALILQMRKDRSTMLYIDLDLYLKSKEETNANRGTTRRTERPE